MRDQETPQGLHIQVFQARADNIGSKSRFWDTENGNADIRFENFLARDTVHFEPPTSYMRTREDDDKLSLESLAYVDLVSSPRVKLGRRVFSILVGQGLDTTGVLGLKW